MCESRKCNYLSFQEYNSKILSNQNSISIVNYNVRSYNANFELFSACLKNSSFPKILVLTETWFSSDYHEDIENYNSFHIFRNGMRSGGVSVYVDVNFKTEKVEEFSFCNSVIEICTVKVNLVGGNHFFLLGLYRPHSGTREEFTALLDQILNSNELRDKKCVLIGDYNINMLSDDESVANFMNTLNSYHYFPLITKPTRFPPNELQSTPSLLDNIWINNICNYHCGIISYDYTDHCPIFCILPFTNVPIRKSEKIKISFRQKTQSNYLIFNELLENFDWNLVKSNDVDVYAENFINTLNYLYCQAFPLRIKCVSRKCLEHPWIDSNLRKLIDYKSTYFKLLRLGIITSAENNFFKNKVKAILRKRKVFYYKTVFHQQQNNMKKTWEFIRKLTSNKVSSDGIKRIVKNNVELTDSFDIAVAFNEYFCNIAHDLDQNLPPSNFDYLSNVRSNNFSFYLNPVSTHECSKIISQLKITKTSKDQIPVRLFIQHHAQYLEIICDLINLSFSKAVFPRVLKLATIIPIFKKGDSFTLGNYRPISILPTLSKVYEKCLYNRLLSFFTKHSILINNQFGFRRNISTSDAVTQLTEYQYNVLNSREIAINVFVDFQKAFDTISRNILLLKLKKYGIRGLPLMLLESYLGGRQQCVRVNGVCSPFCATTYGVPQGSILGPLLFLIYVNDMPNISSNFSPVLFADDTTLCFRGENIENLVELCNNELHKFSQWCVGNRLSLNLDKTFCIVVTNRNINCDIQVSINNRFLQLETSGRFLGMIFDNRLKFKEHIEMICKKISRSIGILYRLRNYLPLSTMTSLYYSLVFPYLNYCIQIWGGTYQSHLNRLEILQKRTIRIVNNAQYYSHTLPLFKSSFVLKLSDVYRFNVAVYMFKNRSDDQYARQHLYNTRGRSELLPSYQRLTVSQQSLSFSGPNIWNSIPQEVREQPNIKLFKKYLKNYLLSNY